MDGNKIRRPRSDGRCVHCRRHLDDETGTTKDHVFPDSWYPDSTPSTVQRWTVPACLRCNNELGLTEKEVFVRLGLCVNPQKVAATGVSKKIILSFGIGAVGIDEEEKRIRAALKQEVLASARRYTDEERPHILPGIGPYPEGPSDQQMVIDIPADKLYEVAKKIVRGSEYWFSKGRIIEHPYEIQIFFAHDPDVPDVVTMFSAFSAFHFGPGFRVRRGVANEDPLSAIYEVLVWDTLKFYASVLAPDEPPGVAQKP
jgi:hypothetical protein